MGKQNEPRFHGEVSEKSHKNMSKIHGKKDTDIEKIIKKFQEDRILY